MAKMDNKSEAKQENHFNLHEDYDSVEELELALSRVADAAMEFLYVVEDTSLPPNLAEGMLNMPLTVYKQKQTVILDKKTRSLAMLESILGGDR